jgi:hypothetical protein
LVKEKKRENREKEKVLNTIITTENEWVCLQRMTSCCEFSCHHKWLGKLQAYIYVSQKKPDFIRTVIGPQTKKKQLENTEVCKSSLCGINLAVRTGIYYCTNTKSDDWSGGSAKKMLNRRIAIWECPASQKCPWSFIIVAFFHFHSMHISSTGFIDGVQRASWPGH